MDEWKTNWICKFLRTTRRKLHLQLGKITIGDYTWKNHWKKFLQWTKRWKFWFKIISALNKLTMINNLMQFIFIDFRKSLNAVFRDFENIECFYFSQHSISCFWLWYWVLLSSIINGNVLLHF
jgi:hypothetical protein